VNVAQLMSHGFDSRRTPFRRLDVPVPDRLPAGPRRLLHVPPETLRRLSMEAFRDINFLHRTRHLEQWAAVLDDPEASENDRFVVAALLKNAALAAEGVLPMCQDTGTSTVFGLKGEDVWTGADDDAALSEGIRDAYARFNLRFSMVAPLSMFEEKNTRSNLPAQVDLTAVPAGSPGSGEYRFLFLAKGGGSANKTSFFQESKAILNEKSLEKFLTEKITAIGTAGCPPYHLGVVIGGTSPEHNLKILKLATAEALDGIPSFPAAGGGGGLPSDSGLSLSKDPGVPCRSPEWEDRIARIARASGIGAQYTGRYLALDVRVIRLARHAASCPVSVGVSCSAHRNALARVGEDGVWLEDFDHDPGRFLPKALPVLEASYGKAPRVSLSRPMREVRAELGRNAVGTLVLLSGPMVVARDAAHARLHALLKEGKPLPRYFMDHPVYYAGPAQTPEGRVIGSFGPTTAQRMDVYLRDFMAAGASLVTLAKGNRSPSVAAACREFGGFYLGTVGGAAALIAQEHITGEELLDFPDLGMEAVRRIQVRDMPAIIVTDDKGNNLYHTGGGES
jgi:fumarate hydratase, class I